MDESTLYFNELYHHGTKGMKWGRRLYQNKDGSLTALGRLRYGKNGEKLTKSSGSSDSSESSRSSTSSSGSSSSTLPRKAKRLSDDDLNSALKRLRAESEYNRLMNEVNPETVSKGRQIAGNVMKRVVLPAAENVGRQIVTAAFTSAVSKSSFGETFKKYGKKKD